MVLITSENFLEYLSIDISHILKQSILTKLVANFIWLYLHQFFNNSHGLNSAGKPLKRPFN